MSEPGAAIQNKAIENLSGKWEGVSWNLTNPSKPPTQWLGMNINFIVYEPTKQIFINGTGNTPYNGTIIPFIIKGEVDRESNSIIIHRINNLIRYSLNNRN